MVPPMTERAVPGSERPGQTALRKFFHDVATPLSAVSLHLERASRLASRGTDATEALATARRELERAFDLFERGRDALLSTTEDSR
jgi:signal transduction histidine kinase